MVILELERHMIHDTDNSHIGLSISPASWPEPHRGLPIRGWPADLFKCDATEAELMTEDLLVWYHPISAVANVQYPTFRA